MSRDLPSLNGLRFFEAAGRHLSFTRAARELHVTQAAVSHRIKRLEAELDTRLFRRLPRRLLLTDAGQELLSEVQACFDRLQSTTARLTRAPGRSVLTVMLRPFFAARWLSPRLSRFWDRYPTIDLRLHHGADLSELVRGEVDMAVRWGRGDWPGVEVELLLPVQVTPVCSPSLLHGPHPLRAPVDLRHHTLLHEESYDLWTQWLAEAGVAGVNPAGPIIDDANVRTQAAIAGQGVTFGALALLADDLQTGRLVAPFEARSNALSYHIVYLPGAMERANVRAFRDWLHLEATGTVPAPAGPARGERVPTP